VLPSYNVQELALDAWSMACLRLEPPDQWLDEWFDTTEAQLTRFGMRVRARGALRDVWGVSRLGRVCVCVS
jgi:hypothetical protein